jgi:hypothetical protein
MISPVAATIVILCFLVVFGVGLPVLNVKIPKFVSYRWCVIVVILALLIGAVIDFEVLSDESRQIVLISGLVIAGLYVLLRTIEKVLANGWLHGATIEAKKGDISVKLTSTSQEEDKNVRE